jgi:cysteinyl-tRNA synthetase
MQLDGKEYSKIIDDSYIARFIEELSNDLNTANALTIVFEVTKELNLSLRKNDMPALVRQYYTLLDMINVLGISYEK